MHSQNLVTPLLYEYLIHYNFELLFDSPQIWTQLMLANLKTMVLKELWTIDTGKKNSTLTTAYLVLSRQYHYWFFNDSSSLIWFRTSANICTVRTPYFVGNSLLHVLAYIKQYHANFYDSVFLILRVWFHSHCIIWFIDYINIALCYRRVSHSFSICLFSWKIKWCFAFQSFNSKFATNADAQRLVQLLCKIFSRQFVRLVIEIQLRYLSSLWKWFRTMMR